MGPINLASVGPSGGKAEQVAMFATIVSRQARAYSLTLGTQARAHSIVVRRDLIVTGNGFGAAVEKRHGGVLPPKRETTARQRGPVGHGNPVVHRSGRRGGPAPHGVERTGRRLGGYPARSNQRQSWGGSPGGSGPQYTVVRATATTPTGPAMSQLQASAAMEMAFNAAG